VLFTVNNYSFFTDDPEKLPKV